MTDQLSSIQTHLWLITALIGLFLAAGLLCNYMRISEGRDLRKMQKLVNAQKYSELLAVAKIKQKNEPGEGNARVYQALALYGLGRLDEARAVAEELKAKVPLHFSEASSILDAIEAAQNER